MTSTAKKLIATATLSLASLAGFAGIAGADTIGPAPAPAPGPIIAIPAPQPQPDPPAPEPQLPIAQPEEGTDPAPDLPLGTPDPGEDPQPFDPPIAQPQADDDPEPQPEPEPQVPTGGDEITADPCAVATHGCGEDDGSIDDITSADDGCTVIIGGPEVCPGDTPEETPGDEPGDTPGDDTPPDEPGTQGGSLPRTGAGIALLAAIGTALTAGGTAARKLAQR